MDVLRTYTAKQVNGWRSLTVLGWPGFIGAIFISLIYQSGVPLPPYSGSTQIMYWCFLITTLVLGVSNSVLSVLARARVHFNPYQTSWTCRNRAALIVALIGTVSAGFIIMWWSFVHG